jgi:hypothetical protein
LGIPGGGGFCAFEAQKLRTHGTFHNARHIKRKTFLGGGLLFMQLACRLSSRTDILKNGIVSRSNKIGLRTEVILWKFFV